MKRIQSWLIPFVICLFVFVGLFPGNAVAAKRMGEFAVYVPGDISLAGSSQIIGDVVTGSGVVNLPNTNTNKIEGDLYTNQDDFIIDGVDETQYREKHPEQDFTFPQGLPNLPSPPEIAKKEGAVTFDWNASPVTEDTHYNQITIQGRMVVDVEERDRIIRTQNLTLTDNAELYLKGNHRLFLFVDSGIHVDGYAKFNQPSTGYNCPGQSGNLHIIIQEGHLNFETNGAKINGNIYLKKGNLALKSGGQKIIGNLVVGGTVVKICNSAEVTGMVYAPFADASLESSGKIFGTLVANSFSASGGNTKVDYKASSLVIPELPIIPIEDPPNGDPSGDDPTGPYQPGLRGEYYDAKDPVKETYKRLTRLDPSIEFNWQLGSPDPSIHPDTFSVRWTGFIQVPVSDVYTFYAFSDDGVRLWLNGQPIIDRWGDVNLEFTPSQPLSLEAGVKYPFKLEYMENYLNATIFLFWQAEKQEFSLVPETAFWVDQPVEKAYVNQVQAIGEGLLGEYYAGEEGVNSGDNPVYTVEGEEINHTWYDASPHHSVPADYFSARWTGYIEGKYTEDCTLEFLVDDGLRFWVNGEEKINEWGPNSHKSFTSTVPLRNGEFTPIKIEYQELTGSAACYLIWQSQGQEREIIPKEYLYMQIPE